MTHAITLEELLQLRRPTWNGAEGLLSYLSAAALAPAAARVRLEEGLAHAPDVAWADLADWVESWPTVPDAPNAFQAWLHDTEDLGLAHAALGKLKLPEGSTSNLSSAIAKTLDAAKAQIAKRNDKARFAGLAAQREEQLGLACAPWSSIPGGTVDELLRSSPDAAREACELWIEGQLHPEDAASMAECVQQDERVLSAYRALAAERTKEVWVTRWNPAWSLDVARTDNELATAHTLLELHLPHSDQTLTVRQHADGTWWSDTGFVPFSTAGDDVAWGDTVLGVMRTKVHLTQPKHHQDAWHALSTLGRIAAGETSQRGVSVTRAIIEDLQNGHMGKVIATAHRAFEDGSDVSDDELRLLDHAFEIRVLLNDALSALSADGVDVGPLTDALDEADERHAGHARATQLVEDDLYRNLTRDIPLDESTWWGSRQLLDRQVPRGVVEGALRALAEERRGSGRQTSARSNATEGEGTVVNALRDPVTPYAAQDASAIDDDVIDIFTRRPIRRTPRELSLEVTQTLVLAAASHEATSVDSDAVPSSWLAHADAQPPPGCVPVLLLDEKNDKGIVAELRVWIDDHDSEADFWGPNSPLQRMARDAIRDAFQAASGATRLKASPYSFASHRVRLIVDPSDLQGAELEVDGRSLGLSAALAFASAWLGRPVARDIVPMGTVSPRGCVGAIRGGALKSAAAVRSTVEGAVRVLTAAAGMAEVAHGSGVPVATIRNALDAAGLDLSLISDGSYTSARERERALDGLVSDIQDSAVSEHGEEPWSRLGDEVRRLADSLDADQAKASKLTHARCMAALAYSHAGRLADVSAVLWEMKRPEAEGLEALALFDIVTLGKSIDARELNEAKGQEALRHLHEDLEALRAASSHVSGQAAGTLGRAYTHLHDLDAALPLLEEAVEDHKELAPHEVPRSRVYLASALRMNGDLHEALEELVVARRELRELTRPYSTEYEASCGQFLNYELARVLVALDRPDEALAFAADALGECETRGWWPLLGVLRVQAWALRMCDRGAEADEVVERMRALRPAEHEDLVQALIEEAERYPVDDGEVY